MGGEGGCEDSEVLTCIIVPATESQRSQSFQNKKLSYQMKANDFAAFVVIGRGLPIYPGRQPTSTSQKTIFSMKNSSPLF